MKIKVFYDRENKEKEVEIDENSTVKDLLKKMNINPETVIVSKNNDIILKEEKLDEKSMEKLEKEVEETKEEPEKKETQNEIKSEEEK